MNCQSHGEAELSVVRLLREGGLTQRVLEASVTGQQIMEGSDQGRRIKGLDRM